MLAAGDLLHPLPPVGQRPLLLWIGAVEVVDGDTTLPGIDGAGEATTALVLDAARG